MGAHPLFLVGTLGAIGLVLLSRKKPAEIEAEPMPVWPDPLPDGGGGPALDPNFNCAKSGEAIAMLEAKAKALPPALRGPAEQALAGLKRAHAAQRCGPVVASRAPVTGLAPPAPKPVPPRPAPPRCGAERELVAVLGAQLSTLGDSEPGLLEVEASIRRNLESAETALKECEK